MKKTSRPQCPQKAKVKMVQTKQKNIKITFYRRCLSFCIICGPNLQRMLNNFSGSPDNAETWASIRQLLMVFCLVCTVLTSEAFSGHRGCNVFFTKKAPPSKIWLTMFWANLKNFQKVAGPLLQRSLG